MELSRATVFALRTALDLAVGGPARTGDIASRRGIPPAQAGKIIQQLVRGGIVRTARGVYGGVRLARPSAAITLRTVVEAIEGPVAVARCPLWDDCPCDQPCPIRTVLSRMQHVVEQMLDEVTVADLSANLRGLTARVKVTGKAKVR